MWPRTTSASLLCASYGLPLSASVVLGCIRRRSMTAAGSREESMSLAAALVAPRRGLLFVVDGCQLTCCPSLVVGNHPEPHYLSSRTKAIPKNTFLSPVS